MLQQIQSQHWHDGAEGGNAAAVTPEPSPVEGKADDGVKSVPVHVLVVTHGAYMCVAMRYFVEELHCPLPEGCDKTRMFSVSPNTGLCRFLLTVRKENHSLKPSRIHCVFMHRADHIKN